MKLTLLADGFAAELAGESDTEKLMRDLAAALRPGDVVALSGDLGAGKTTFARALIRHLANNPDEEAPSPTFTLMQAYELPPFPLLHLDLYRVADPAELIELGFEDRDERAVVLMEWPERGGDLLPADRFEIALQLAAGRGADHRDARLVGHGAFAERARRIGLIRDLLDRSGFTEAKRSPLAGDASTRAYERLLRPGAAKPFDAVLMNAPRRPDGPPVKNGKPYSAIARLAEDVAPFIGMARGLHARGFSAPEIHAADLDNGLLILEDLGDGSVVAGAPPAPLPPCYMAATEMLAALHGMDLPDRLPVAPGIDHVIPPYDLDAMLIEVELLPAWYLSHAGIALPQAALDAFFAAWREALQPLLDAPKTWVLRDFHSPNIVWLPAREGVRKVGLLDFQDAVMGPAAYDVASLAQDARVDVPEAMEAALLGAYVASRRRADPAFDAALFAQHYATMAAQRATKILGIFARLDRRDGKPQYLRHLPRIQDYLRRALAHPALAPLADWHAAHLPGILRR
ncbi:MAG TPA: tRNA (adenosine(37)-N6)-threonylcarbamoyltransferase complex ATPase subunit type 1 TsaE [Xanthobacteraceae bacterium]|nr:tRNA (adenosine(37)-N6)-threonylcarbamoyltransferase complex ATPase subunit type 1 TsaE [Xanthobacteraceae bacterium]